VAWGDDPGIRIIAGPPTAVDTLGGFVVWDAGLYLTLAIAAWAITTTSRLVRGDEAAGRTEVVLAGPIRATRVLLTQLLVLLGACVAVGLALAIPLAAAGAQVQGAAAFGAAQVGFAATTVAVTAVSSQILVSRAGASGLAAAVIGLGVLVRMVSNSTESRAWLGWLTPSGWLDQLRAFGDNRWAVLLVPLAVTATLVAAAAAIRRRRDAGAALLAERSAPRSRRWGLGSAGAFAWRANLGPLLGWAAGTAAWGAVVGTMAPTVGEFLVDDPGFQAILAAMGMDVSDLVRGFVGMSGTILGLVIAVYAAFRMGATRAEESSTRAELLLTRPIRRRRWLAGHVLGLGAAVVLLAAVAAGATCAGAAIGGADVTAGDAFAAVFNAFPAITVFAGLTVLVFGVAPRLTVALGATVPLAAYVLEVVGPLMEWPEAVVGLSPFHHLEEVPVDTFGLTAAIVMTAVGVALAAVGIGAFERRDLVGA
jgi:ABC-2 type transport system permease protein